jgi:hypothetical protein
LIDERRPTEEPTGAGNRPIVRLMAMRWCDFDRRPQINFNEHYGRSINGPYAMRAFGGLVQ